MRHAERGAAAGRFAIASLMASLAIALAGCGGNDGTSATGAAATTNTSVGSNTTPMPAADTSTVSSSGSNPTTTGSGSTTTGSTATPPPPPKASTASITLGWVPPTQNNDGSPITNLAGYKIRYGTTPSEYTQTIALQNAGLTRYVIDNLSTGTYYFAITAYNSLGIESAMSGEISTIVN